MDTFTFAPNSKVPETLTRETSNTVTMNGWLFSARPTSPMQRRFRLVVHGLRWYLNTDDTYDATTNPTINARALENFYSAHEMWDPFIFPHPHLGNLVVKFAAPLNVPAGQKDGGGLLEPLEIMLVEAGMVVPPAPSPFLNSAYAMALDFAHQGYYKAGVQYGNTEGPELAEHTATTDYTPDGHETLSFTGGKLLITKTADVAGVYQILANTPKLGKRYRIRGSVTSTSKVRVYIAANVALRDDNGSNYIVDQSVAGTYTFDKIVTVMAAASNVIVYIEVASSASWAANGQTVTINSLSFKEVADVSRMPGYEFTRTGTMGGVSAEGTVKFVAPNVPLIDSNGYYAYNTLTNKVLNSNDFSVSSWTVGNGVLTVNAATAPDGTMTADRLVDNSTFERHYVIHTVPPPGLVAASEPSITGFIKRASGNINIGVGSQWANEIYDPDTGAALGNSVYAPGNQLAVQLSTVPMANGWFRAVNRVNNVSDALIPNPIFELTDLVTDSTNHNYSGVGAGAYIWGAQLLVDGAGGFPWFKDGGPIIVTTGAAATIGNNYMTMADDLGTDADQLFMVRGNTSASDRTLAYWGGIGGGTPYIVLSSWGPAFRCLTWTGSVAYVPTEIAVPYETEAILVLRRLSGAWRFGVVLNGVLTWSASAAASQAFPLTTGTLTVGAYYAPGGGPDGKIKGVYRKLGAFTTDASVLAAALEIA